MRSATHGPRDGRTRPWRHARHSEDRRSGSPSDPRAGVMSWRVRAIDHTRPARPARLPGAGARVAWPIARPTLGLAPPAGLRPAANARHRAREWRGPDDEPFACA